ncbi:Nramp family divalent metal transporter [Aquimarina algicola]|uniref:Divalent metal cation transporter n=1 Tax=Aquimarina algicola TaxID=2589995 RepID=A0A504J7T5_9FLAO|nr:Nramp family divalent metal transporter [Aquimarina algicola]TPN82221.1 divalent metal cation transporter [Aquimarina algicola]
MKNWFSNIGPGTLVTAAFIGPGTVTICTLAGAQHGYSLLWALILSIIACIVLQEMAARLGVVTQKGLSEVLKSQFDNKLIRFLFLSVIISAIVIGNSAYEAGNISGGTLGLSVILGESNIVIDDFSFNYLSLVIGTIAFLLLYFGNYKILERGLIVLVLLMSLAFTITAIMTKPDVELLIHGFIPNFESDNLFMVIGLIGTTVVPYNLFLHAATVKEKWNNPKQLPYVRKDTIISIVLGGIISISIIISSTVISKNTSIEGVVDLAKSLEPLFGAFAKYILSIGLLAAGVTSAITAPLAAAYVIKGCMGWDIGLKDKKFRMVWMIVLVLGIVFSSLNIKPIRIIQFAQIANGLLLPIITSFLLWVMNKKDVLGKYTNSIWQNSIGFMILLLVIFLGIRGIYNAI